jgi:hypothetical protein
VTRPYHLVFFKREPRLLDRLAGTTVVDARSRAAGEARVS